MTSSGGACLGNAPFGGVCLGNTTSGGACFGNFPSGGACLGNVPSGGAYLGNTTSGGAYLGNTTSGGACFGNAPSGGVYLGNTTSGGACLGNVPFGGACLGVQQLRVDGAIMEDFAWKSCSYPTLDMILGVLAILLGIGFNLPRFSDIIGGKGFGHSIGLAINRGQIPSNTVNFPYISGEIYPVTKSGATKSGSDCI
eukprot:sb/3470852/